MQHTLLNIEVRRCTLRHFSCTCQALTALEELYLSHNGISELVGLEPLSQLRILDVSSNRWGGAP